MTSKKERKQVFVKNRIAFYKSFFTDEEGYEEKEVNGWWLIKHWDGNYQAWTVDLYSKSSYENYKKTKSNWNKTAYLDEGFQHSLLKD